MLLEHVIMFCKIANEKSISKVAQANHISQPALSLQMQRLEEELGVKLFERSNRGIQLTKAGIIMQKYGLQFMQSYDNLREELDNLKSSKVTFRIAASPVICDYALPCILYKANQKFPDYSFTLNGFPSNEVIAQIRNEQADLGFIVGNCRDDDIVCNDAFVDKIYLVAKTGYNIKSIHSLDDLKRYPLIMLNENFSSYRLVYNYLKQKGCTTENFKINYHLNTTEAVKSAVIAGHGLAFLPYMAIKKEVYMKELQIIEFPDFNLNYDVHSIYRTKEGSLGTTQKEIIQYLIHNVNKNIC
ncbi:LysR family transcriptional regulator [Acetivibrio ethanolgignens]|uniref:HTH lysR-type domain-containing protein n=1 Tax=Acetivibrio ethanolgignens TaxID=290052 RepID=A0A0V8QEK2_9FIRM|nr:LysR family transcriptional regulator [Acetivibrio ethanolgignens]KSV59013.1 hypothetical protein ASU35_01445 [Acetivibrio ethanolgignens]